MRVASKCHFVQDSQIRSLKFFEIELLTFWKAITSYVNLRLKWSLKQSCSSHWEISNNMWHAIYMHVFQDDSRLLMGESQIDTLTPDPSFGHNLCFKYSNGSCKPILHIYILRAFKWYKKLFNPMNFGPWYIYLKIWDSQSESSLGNVWVHSFTFPRMQMWLPGNTLSPHRFMLLLWLWALG